jgi:hypothetical protein
MADNKGKNNTAAEKAREKQVKTALTNAGVNKKTIDTVIKQASRTGVGLSVNEAANLINRSGELKKSKPITTLSGASKFLGTLQSRLDYNARILNEEKKGDQGGNQGGGGGSEPIFELPPPPPQMVRVPERDVVSLAQETISAETIVNLLFENVGANELTKFVRHDTVEGINPYYDVISNLSDIKRKFDPSNLISLQKTTSSLFDIFPIKLQDKIPSDAYLLENNLTDYIYIDTNGNLVIEVVNLKDSEIVEIEIDTNGTIYEVDE